MPSYTPLPDGRVRCRYDIPASQLGNRRQRSFTAKSEKEARREYHRREREMEETGVADPSRMVLRDYLAIWLRDHAEATLRPPTVQTYRQLVKTYIEPQLGHIPLSRLTAGQVQVLLSGLVREGKAPSSVHLVHNVLAGALNLAVTWGYLPRSPCRGLSLPPMEPKEPVAMDPGQMRRLLALAEGTRFHAPIVLGLATGLRRSELLGLRWRDVDTEARVLQVRQALKQAQGRPLELGPPKTRGSRRTVQLPEALLPVLARHRAEQARQRLQLGDLWQDQGLVFPAEDGNPWKPSLFSDGMRRLFRRAGLPEMTARNLRHSFATAVAPEVDMKTLAAILGHTGPEMTWRYVRASEAQRAKAAEATDRALRGVLDAVP